MVSLTDGRNLYGDILSIRSWMNQLARRHELETERPLVAHELNLRYASQKRILLIMTWLAAVLAAAVGFIILIDRMLRMRQATRIRERFAADLHDELGANIHTIGLLGDLAREAKSHEELLELLDRSREFTERSGVAIRNWTNMLESRGLCEDLAEEMKRSASNLLADLDHDLSFEGTEFLQKLKPRKRIDIFFFYKECLTNIIRHSGATRVTIRLEATPEKVTLTINDNGLGLDGGVPNSLKRRARLLGAKATVRNSTDGGTCVIVQLRTPKNCLVSLTQTHLRNPMKSFTKVMLVEDHAGYREVITRTLDSAPKIELVSQFGTAEIALREIQNLRNIAPDLVLLDLNLPGMSGLEAIPWFKQYVPKIRIIILTQSNREADVMEAISLGASGYLLKSATATQIKEGIDIVANGGAALDPSVARFILQTFKTRHSESEPKKSLSSRELEILSLLGDGLVKKEIADRLDISVTTVAYHIKHIYGKLEVQNAPSAVAKGFKSGLL